MIDEIEIKATFPQALHVSDAHLPLDTAADVVELLRWQCHQLSTRHFR